MIGIERVSYYLPPHEYDLFSISDIQELGLNEKELGLYRDKYRFYKISRETEKKIQEMVLAAVSKLPSGKDETKKVQIVFVHALPVSQGIWSHVVREIATKLNDMFTVPSWHTFSHLNCASIHGAFRLIQAKLKATDLNGVLLISADKNIDPALRRLPHSLMGDGVAVCHINKQSKINQLIHTELMINPRTYRGIDSSAEDLYVYDFTLIMSARKVILKALQKSNLGLREIKLFVVSNVNYYFWELLAHKMDLDLNKFYFASLSTAGHLYNSDILVNYCLAVEERRLTKGDYYMTLSIGLGSAIGCSVLQY